jgi:hypothetical protein
VSAVSGCSALASMRRFRLGLRAAVIIAIMAYWRA